MRHPVKTPCGAGGLKIGTAGFETACIPEPDFFMKNVPPRFSQIRQKNCEPNELKNVTFIMFRFQTEFLLFYHHRHARNGYIRFFHFPAILWKSCLF